ncbi:MAG: helix-turn-helix domain-containing protein [Crocinitomicaceae bacterium]|nr:helix-turn-helix domain-containing protein [Crocinitomicaceae bacterium]
MQHKGEIIERCIRESGYSITKLAKRMGKSRRWVYQIFESSNVSIDYILDIGKIIHHDFSEDINELKSYSASLANQMLMEPPQKFESDKEEVEFWKNKYLLILEKYNELLTNKE